MCEKCAKKLTPEQRRRSGWMRVTCTCGSCHQFVDRIACGPFPGALGDKLEQSGGLDGDA